MLSELDEDSEIPEGSSYGVITESRNLFVKAPGYSGCYVYTYVDTNAIAILRCLRATLIISCMHTDLLIYFNCLVYSSSRNYAKLNLSILGIEKKLASELSLDTVMH